MKTFQLSEVDCPQVIFECGGHKIETETIKNVKQNPNFAKPVVYFDIVSCSKFLLAHPYCWPLTDLLTDDTERRDLHSADEHQCT